MARIFLIVLEMITLRRGVFANEATELELDNLAIFKTNDWKVTR